MANGNNNGEHGEPLIETWKRFNEAAAEEKRWMSDRLNWMFTPQALLIGAFALIQRFGDCKGKEEGECGPLISQTNELVWVIWGVGLAMSVLGFIGLRAAGIMHWKWTTRINCLAKKINGDLPLEDYHRRARVPFGSDPHWPARSSSIIPQLIALMFVFAWLYMIIFVGR